MKRLVVSLFLLTGVAAAPQPQVDLPVTEAIVFKNGLAFMTREGTLAFRNDTARVAPAPDALLGTLWIAAGDRVVDVVRASKEDWSSESAATTVAALIDANPGKVATLLVDDRVYTGKLLAAPTESEIPAPSATAAPWSGTVAPPVDRLVLLEVDGKVTAFPRSSVKTVAFAERPLLRGQVSSSRAVLSLHARGADGPQPATIRYLRSGVSWIPDYTIELLDGRRARVSMRATLINDGETLSDARIRFAVGYPNFGFAGAPSPLTLRQTLAEFLSSLARDPSGSSSRVDNVMSQQVTLNYATNRGDETVFPGPPTTGESAEDLFFYEKSDVTLAKGERALYPILSEVVPFRHLYVWTIPDETEETRGYGAAARKPLADQVWHSISLTNSGTTPWTTAPALVTVNGKPLAQDTLPYTAAGGRGEMKLTVATDVSVERKEEEVERKPRDLQRAGYTYDAVTIEGTLTARSFKRAAITLDIAKNIAGQSILRDPEAKVTRRAVEPKAVNPSERLEWQLELAAGATRTVRYRYRVWVRE